MTAEDRNLTVVLAPDSFKGSLSSIEVATAIATGWARARPNDRLLPAPLADGGEGTLLAIEASGGWRRREGTAEDPLGRPISAFWLESEDGGEAVVELALASGLSRVAPGERNPLVASTFGTGQLLVDVLDSGIRRATLGLGGSATTDGGSGILRALGARFLDSAGMPVGAGGAALASLARVDLSGLDPRLAQLHLRIASDVDNPLLGPRGAAAVYGPQKGLSPEQVRLLDAALANYAERLAEASAAPGWSERVRAERDRPGAGAAGGTTFGLAAIADHLAEFTIVPGVDVVMEQIDLDGKLSLADLVITGEGRIDEQTGYGKTALGVARRARAAGVACVALGGGIVRAGVDALQALGAVVVPVIEAPMTIEEAIGLGREPVEHAGERVAQLVTMGMTLRDSP